MSVTYSSKASTTGPKSISSEIRQNRDSTAGVENLVDPDADQIRRRAEIRTVI
jgi:hypothetical protein